MAVAGKAVKPTMEPREYELMFELERHHWWFQSRLAMIERLLDRHVWPQLDDSSGNRPRLVDLGCGTGMFLERRRAHCRTVGLDFSRQALALCRRNGLDALAQADATRLPLADACADVLTAFDLIEHVNDDRSLIAESWRILRPGGFLMATVPAHPAMWSGHDVSLHHMRRYRRRQFEALFTSTPDRRWQTIRMTSSFTTVFVPTVLLRITRRAVVDGGVQRSDTRPTPPWMNRILLALHRPEIAWLGRFNLPTGVSLMTIRQKIA
jgi:SAM-dependent methyltransferase